MRQLTGLAKHQAAGGPLGRVASRASVLEASVSTTSDCSESETTSPVDSPHGPVGLPLLDAVMGTVCAAARSGSSLPQRTRQLLQQLFPSSDAITATVPSADGLGVSVVTLMQPAPPSSPRCASTPPALHPAAAQQVAQPLAAGGLLSFGLMAQPPAAEQQLMAAFAAELSSRLGVGPGVAAAHPACAPGTAFGTAMPLDCFWAPF